MKKNLFLSMMLLWAGGLVGVMAQQDCGTVKDYDGNVYKTVQLGKQCWMAENLRVTHFPDGKALKLGMETSETEKYFYYPNGEQSNAEKYGLLYSWNTCMTGSESSEKVPSGVQSLCPDGWHLPSNYEWMGLEDYLGYKDEYRCGTDVNNVAKCMAAKEEWKSPNLEFMTRNPECSIVDDLSKNNTSGMNVLPAGNFFHSIDGFGLNAGFWTATEGSDVTSPIHQFYSANATVEINCTPKDAAYSVRCVKNE